MVKQKYLTKNLMIQLTNNCPNCCSFCLNADGSKKKDFLSLNEVENIIKKFKPRNIEFTGGETFSDMRLLVSAVDVAKQAGVENVRINTNLDVKKNNVPISSLDLKKLSKFSNISIFVCIQTLNPSYYKTFRSNKKANLNRVFRNINYLLKKTNLEFVPGFVPTKNTIGEFPKIYDYVCELSKKYPLRVGTIEYCKLILSGRATKEIEASFENQFNFIKSIIPLTHPIESWCYGKNSSELEKLGISVHKCSFGKDSFYVTVSGKVLIDNSIGAPPLAEHFSKFDVKKYVTSKEAKKFVCPLAG